MRDIEAREDIARTLEQISELIGMIAQLAQRVQELERAAADTHTTQEATRG